MATVDTVIVTCEHGGNQVPEPYRTEVERLVALSVSKGHLVIHLSSYSFTPKLGGKVRSDDVGLLYDPARPGPSQMCARWKHSLAASAPEVCVRRNYPDAGTGDGLTSHLRKRFLPRDYVGIELELNQRIVFAADQPWAILRRALIGSLREPGTPPIPRTTLDSDRDNGDPS